MKNFSGLALAIGLISSFNVMAAATALTTGGSTTVTSGSAGACNMLANDVVVTLSKNVHGAYNCDETITTINVGTCNEGGSRAPLTVQCTSTTTNNVTTYTPSTCAAGVTEVVISNYRGFTASSQGGSVTAEDLGTNCTDASLGALDIFQ